MRIEGVSEKIPEHAQAKVTSAGVNWYSESSRSITHSFSGRMKEGSCCFFSPNGNRSDLSGRANGNTRSTLMSVGRA